MLKRIALVLITVVILAVPASAQTGFQGVFQGMITDSEGAAISGAHIVIHWDPSGSDPRGYVGVSGNVGIKQDLTLTTAANGSFAAELPPGFYDVLVSAAAFSPDCQKIRIESRKTATYNAKLKVSSLVLGELGNALVPKPK